MSPLLVTDCEAGNNFLRDLNFIRLSVEMISTGVEIRFDTALVGLDLFRGEVVKRPLKS